MSAHGFLQFVSGSGPRSAQVIPLEWRRPYTVVGRDADAEIRIDDPTKRVSRRHCAIEQDEHGFHIVDAGGQHGTTVNGVRLSRGERRALATGDEIAIAGIATLRFMASALTPNDPSADPGEGPALSRAAAPAPPVALRGASALVGDGPAMRLLRSEIRAVAAAGRHVLVVGPSGSGKELVARALHEESRRRGGPFIAMNAATLSQGTAESELFGHAKGAFTGAAQDRPGLVTAADRGVLFLDEIGAASLDVQEKLLRLPETGEVRPVGETGVRRVDVLLVAATSRDIDDERRFLPDFRHRFPIVLRVPTLAERPEDTSALAAHLLRTHAAAARRPLPAPAITAGAVARLAAHGCPSNQVRELSNLLANALTFNGWRTITEADIADAVLRYCGPGRSGERTPTPLPWRAAPPAESALEATARRRIAEIPEPEIEQALARSGSLSRAAEALRVPKQTLSDWKQRRRGAAGEGSGRGDGSGPPTIA